MAKILLVEDDKSLREIYGVRLLAEGYDIVSAGDGEEALAMAIKDRPDLILSDVMMPKISGFDMLDILRSTTETKGIKVIMMTALSSEDQRQRGVALGADRYLVKSQVGIEDVVRTVHEVLADAPVLGAPAGTPPAAPAAPTPQPVAQPAPAPLPAPIPQPQAPVPPAPQQPAPFPPPQAPHGPQPLPAPSSLPQPSAPFSTPRNTLASRVIEPLAAGQTTPPTDFSHLMSQELSGGPAPAPLPPPQPMPQPPVMPAPQPLPATPVPQAMPQPAPAPQAQMPSVPQPAPAAMAPGTPVPQAPPQPAPQLAPQPQPTASGLNFEETPRPAPPTPPSPSA
ncbi:MAG: response regulator [Candidatus Saccharimonas sp.]